MARAMAASVALLAGVVGPPWALLRFVGSPLPHGVPSVDEVLAALTRPPDPHLVLQGLAWVCWVAWAVFVLDVLAAAGQQLADHIRNRHDQHRAPARGGTWRPGALLIGVLIAAMLTISRPAPAGGAQGGGFSGSGAVIPVVHTLTTDPPTGSLTGNLGGGSAGGLASRIGDRGGPTAGLGSGAAAGARASRLAMAHRRTRTRRWRPLVRAVCPQRRHSAGRRPRPGPPRAHPTRLAARRADHCPAERPERHHTRPGRTSRPRPQFLMVRARPRHPSPADPTPASPVRPGGTATGANPARDVPASAGPGWVEIGAGLAVTAGLATAVAATLRRIHRARTEPSAGRWIWSEELVQHSGVPDSA